MPMWNGGVQSLQYLLARDAGEEVPVFVMGGTNPWYGMADSGYCCYGL